MDYKRVIEAYQDGTIDPHKWALRMDNDGGYWEYLGEDLDYDAEVAAIAMMEDLYGSPDGYRDLVRILVAAGVNADWV